MKRAALILVLGLLVAGCGAGGSSGDYRVDALFDNASFLIPGQDVRIAGANVGTVTDVRVTPDHRARISMKLDRRFAPFKADADCFIAPQSLIGERFIQCAPGTAGAKPLPGDVPTVPVTNTHSPVDPDLIAATFRLPVRQRLAIILNELGAGVAGNGRNLNAVLRRANPAMEATQDVLRILARDRAVLGDLVDRSDVVIGELAKRRGRVADFIEQAAQVSQTAAARQGAISEGLRRLPETLDETRSSLRALTTLSQRSRPLLGDLRAAAPSLTRLVHDAPPLAKAARPALEHLASMSRTGTETLRDGAPVVKQLRDFARLGIPAGQLVAELNESLRNRGVVEGLQSFVYNIALSISRYDGTSHILPSYLVAPGQCAVFATFTVPGCDAHFVQGAATSTRRKQRARHRTHRARTHHERAQAAPQRDGSAPSAPAAPAKPSAPASPLKSLTDAVEQLVPKPPPLPLPAQPKTQTTPQSALDYLLGK
jgi:phospholipid/cholesterol/gamma-HCH transport system substrate-binding protein